MYIAGLLSLGIHLYLLQSLRSQFPLTEVPHARKYLSASSTGVAGDQLRSSAGQLYRD